LADMKGMIDEDPIRREFLSLKGVLHACSAFVGGDGGEVAGTRRSQGGVAATGLSPTPPQPMLSGMESDIILTLAPARLLWHLVGHA